MDKYMSVFVHKWIGIWIDAMYIYVYTDLRLYMGDVVLNMFMNDYILLCVCGVFTLAYVYTHTHITISVSVHIFILHSYTSADT